MLSFRHIFNLFILLFLESTYADNCGGTTVLNATASPQILTTPNYASNYTYPPSMNCEFIIKAPDKTRVVVNLIELEMEPRVFTDCVDYVSVQDGSRDSKNESYVYKFCEKARNRQVITKGNTAIVMMISDDLFNYRGAKFTYQYFEKGNCPPGWIESPDDTCLFMEPNLKTDWITAQNRCMEAGGNLAMFKSVDMIELFKERYKISTRLWVGHHDAITESKLMSIDGDDVPSELTQKTNSGPSDNNDDNDCVAFDSPNGALKMDSCSTENGYVCEQQKTNDTAFFTVPVQQIQEGAYSRSSQYSLWLLLFLIGLLFLTILAFLCFMCWKQKDTARVHTESSQVQQNAFLNDSTSAPRVTIPIPTVAAATNNAVSPPRSAREPYKPPSRLASPVVPEPEPTPILPPLIDPEPVKEEDINRTTAVPQVKKFPSPPMPNKLSLAADNAAQTEKVSVEDAGTEAMTEAGLPEPLPRTSLPPRDATFHSIQTRESTTTRTRKNKELFERPVMHVLDNVSAISLDEFWSNKKVQQ